MGEANYLVISPQDMAFGVGELADDPGHHRVLVSMDYDAAEAPWLAPNIRLALSMTPEEARSMALALMRTADSAEAASSPKS